MFPFCCFVLFYFFPLSLWRLTCHVVQAAWLELAGYQYEALLPVMLRITAQGFDVSCLSSELHLTTALSRK